MKQSKRTPREEKRRVLLNENFENGTLQTNGLGVMAKLQNVNKRVLAVVLAIVFVLTVVPTAVMMVVKGASSSEGTKLNLTAANNYTYTVPAGGMDSGVYNVYYGGRTYVYDLNFAEEGSRLEGKLLPGDTVVFNPDNKQLTWNYDPSHSKMVNVESLADATKTGDEITLKLKGGQAALTAGTEYYYVDNETGNYYLFNINEDVLGYKAGDSAAAYNEQTANYYYERKLTDPSLINSAENPLTIHIDISSGNTTISGDQLKRRQIYVKATGFTDKGVYLIRAADGTLFTASTQSPSKNGLNDKGDSDTFQDCKFDSYSKKHTYTAIAYDSTNTLVEYSSDSEKLYTKQGVAYTYSNLTQYYDGGDSEDALALSEFRAKQMSNQVITNVNTAAIIGTFKNYSYSTSYTAYYLFGYDQTGETGHQNFYTSNKALGQMYINSSPAYVTLHDLCEGTSRSKSGNVTNGFKHNDKSLWNYSNDRLSARYGNYSSNTNARVTTGYLYQNGENYQFTPTAANASSFEIYQRTSAYEPTTYNEEANSSLDKLVSRSVSPRTVTYTETETSDNGLELKKTVTDRGNDVFQVQLESYTTGEKLNIPDTDIMLILDTSKNMSNVLYKRDYQNLNTYATFEEKKLSEVQYNEFHDGDNLYNGASIDIWNSYSKNKYLEDPNTPGSYVYVSSTYHYSWGSYYKFSFTDSYGNLYETEDYSPGQTGWHSITEKQEFKLIKTAAGHSASEFADKAEYTSFFYRTDSSENNPSLNINLYKYSKEGGGKGLYYIMNGIPYEVSVHKTTEKVNSPVYGSQTNVTKYEYSVTIDGKTYTTVQGNEKYGADYGVFQGFRNYIYDKDGDLTLDDSKNNLLSKTLYAKTGANATSVTAMQAMKEAIEEFLLSSHSQALVKKSGVNIGLVTYDKAATVQYTLNSRASNYTKVKKPVGEQSIDNMISAVYNYAVTDTYASELGEAMQAAYNQLNTYSKAGNRRYAALFTAGVPADYTTWGWPVSIDTSSKTFDTKVADSAINYAYRMKNNLGTTVYSVGLFDNANENKINGKYWYYQFSEKVRCTGRVGSYWGGSWVANYGYSMDPKDAYATNRMLAYISSDYSSPTYLGLTRGQYSPSYSGLISSFVTRGYGYRIDRNFSSAGNEKSYYFGVSPKTFDEDAKSEDDSGSSLSDSEVKAILTDVFSQLENDMAIPNSKLDGSATMIDGITEYFKLANGADVSSVTARAEGLNGNSPKETEELKVEVKEENTVSVTGFNYEKHYQGSEDPQKLVVTFDITRADDFIGGNDIPTNQPKSGIYDGDKLLEETFDIPHADVSIQLEHVTLDSATYYGSSVELSELLEPKWIDGTNNAFVDIEYTFKDSNGKVNTYTIPAGESIGTWDKAMGANGENAEYIFYQMLNTTDFTVECKVTPSVKGSVPEKKLQDETATVYVYQPHITVHNDMVENAGDSYKLTDVPAISWVVHNQTGEEIKDASLLETINGYLGDQVEPNVSYDITKDSTAVIQVIAEYDATENKYVITSTPADGKQTIPETTDYVVANVQVVPATFSYETEEVVTKNYYNSDDGSLIASYDVVEQKYYNASREEMEKAAAESAINGITPEEINGIVTEYVNRPAANASKNEDVTFLNTTEGDGRTTGAFTIKLHSHDVTIINHTVDEANGDSDFADRTKEFPLTLTMKDENDNFSGDITYTKSGSTEAQTLTFSNGVATINLKNDDSIVLKDVPDGNTITVTSNPADNYYFYYKTGITGNALGNQEESDENESTRAISISDDMTIDLTHSIQKIVITGFHGIGSKLNPFIIAAGAVAVLGGAYVGYLYRRRRLTEEQ